MAQERPNRLAEWFTAARDHAPQVRRSAGEWLQQVREEPRLIWETPAVRYATYGVVALIGGWLVTVAVAMITPPPPAGAKPEATTADFHVLCANDTCGHHFVINRKFGFSKFPVECPRCKKQTGMAARRCDSPTCRGRWIVPVAKDGGLTCPSCGVRFD